MKTKKCKQLFQLIALKNILSEQVNKEITNVDRNYIDQHKEYKQHYEVLKNYFQLFQEQEVFMYLFVVLKFIEKSEKNMFTQQQNDEEQQISSKQKQQVEAMGDGVQNDIELSSNNILQQQHEEKAKPSDDEYLPVYVEFMKQEYIKKLLDAVYIVNQLTNLYLNYVIAKPEQQNENVIEQPPLSDIQQVNPCSSFQK